MQATTVFTDDIIDESNVDYNRWMTVNGDYINISEAANSYIERNLNLLIMCTERYPRHPNYSIWSRYIKVFEEELDSRDMMLV